VALLGQLFMRNQPAEIGGMLLEARPAVHAGAKGVDLSLAKLQRDS
jgi:hypothetical protein